MSEATEFEKASQGKQESFPIQFLHFLAQNKKWWLLPIVLILGLVSVLAISAAVLGPSAPFIYTIF